MPKSNKFRFVQTLLDTLNSRIALKTIAYTETEEVSITSFACE